MFALVFLFVLFYNYCLMLILQCSYTLLGLVNEFDLYSLYSLHISDVYRFDLVNCNVTDICYIFVRLSAPK